MSKLTLRYSRERMFHLRESELSKKRPSHLSTDFNNEHGLFSPDLWLEHRWQCEGVENRVGGRRTKAPPGSKIDSSALDETILSPQRRGFSSGCRAPSPKSNDSEAPQTKSSAWRHGKTVNGMDFKPAFQKTALENRAKTTTSGWRGSNGESMKHWPDKSSSRSNARDRTISSNTTDEKVPEWLDEAPTSTSEIIELRGFDDDLGSKKSKKQRSKAHRENARAPSSLSMDERKEPSRSSSALGSRPPSSPLSMAHPPGLPSGNGSLLSSLTGGSNRDSTERTISPKGRALLNGLGPIAHSDAEFAAIMGILDPANIEPAAVDPEQNAQPAASRFSRFFSRSNPEGTDVPKSQGGPRPIMGQSDPLASHAVADGGNAVLQKLFATANAPKTTTPPLASVCRSFRLEDIEREYKQKPSYSHDALTASSQNAFPNAPLNEQAILSMLSRQQRLSPSSQQQGVPRVSPLPNHESAAYYSNYPPPPLALGSMRPPINPAPAFLRSPLIRPDGNAVNNLFLQAHLHQNAALLQSINAARAAHNSPGFPGMSMPSGLVSTAAPSDSQTSSASVAAGSGGRSIPNNSYLPTSVMRQMNKPPRTQNSSAGQSSSTTPVNVSDNQSPTNRPLASSPVATKKIVPLGIDVNPYTPSAYSAAASAAAAAMMANANAPMNPWRMPIPPMAVAAFNADQQALAMAVQRNDMAAAEAARARIIAQVQAFASLPTFPPYIPHHIGMGVAPAPLRDIPSPPFMGSPTKHMEGAVFPPERLSTSDAENALPSLRLNPLDQLLSSNSTNDSAGFHQPQRPSGPAILNQLPPSAKKITVEDLERDLAASANFH